MSGTQSLVFGRLEVRRSPGIQTPYVLDDLSNGINIIHGPNASGKTTSAQAIHALLWPEPPCWPRGALSGLLKFDGSEWFLDFDAGRFRCQRDGTVNTRLPVSGYESRERYILTLHDLLQADNASFAETILRESAGGYDVDAAIGQLRYRNSPTRPGTLLSRLNETKKALQEARQTQQTLVVEQERLNDLRARRDESRQARSRADLLTRAIRVKEAELALVEARRAVQSFPSSMELIRGDEVTALKKLRARLSGYEDRRERDQAAIVSAKDSVAKSGLDGVEVSPGLVARLRAECQRLQELTGGVERERQSWREAVKQRESSRSRIGDHIQEAQLNEIELAGLRELQEAIEQFDEARAQATAENALHDWVGDVVPPSNLDQLREGISCLIRWLRTPGARSTPDDVRQVRIARTSAILVIILALLLAILSHWFFALLALLGVALFFLSRPASATIQMERLNAIQNDFDRLGITPVDSWTQENVEKLLSQLNDELRKGIVEDEKAQRWGKLSQQREAASKARDELMAKRDELAETYGVVPESASELMLLAQNLERWQQADVEARQARDNLERATSAERTLLDRINQELDRFGYEPAGDHAAMLANIEDLNERVQSFDEASRIITERRRSLADDVAPEIDRVENEIRDVFSRLTLNDGDDEKLQELVDQLKVYTDAVERRKQAEFELDSATSGLGDHNELLRLDLTELEAERDQSNELTAQYDDLHKLVSAIEARIDEAKQKHDVERAMSAEADAIDALRTERDQQYRLVAGWSLGEFIRQQTQDRDRPHVFHRSRELFSRMTYGRYRLELAGNPEPEFRATDTSTGRGLALDELSSATRVQLLMAVRMAFVEEMEQGPKLPLILDEVLGNSDESRARAIIDATIEICRDGRQIFYFTAQHDEVGKWLSILNGRDDVNYKEIDLAEVRGLADIERLPTLNVIPTPTAEIPSPDGKSRQEYRDVIGIPGIDRWSDFGSVHLWYLVPNLEALHHLLSNHIHTWGQLKTVVELGRGNLLEQFPGAFECAAARMDVIHAAVEAWRIGRGRTVDRAALLESNAVSDRFMDEVAQLTNEVRGDASVLIGALERGQVKGFRHAAIEDFRSYCLDHGYLSDAEPLSADDLKVRVVAAVASDLTSGLISSNDVDELVATAVGVS